MTDIQPPTLLLIDGDPEEVLAVRRALPTWNVEDVRRLSAGLARLTEPGIEVVLATLELPDAHGLDVARDILARAPHTPLLVLAGEDDERLVGELLERGVTDVLPRPGLAASVLNCALRYAVQRQRLLHDLRLCRRELQVVRDQVFALRARLGESIEAMEIVGDAPATVALRQAIATVAATDSPVLIEGEPGTGKQLAAAVLHARSARAAGPFIPVHCGALPAEIGEAELFGAVRVGPGGVSESRGLLRSADRGTLFLDAITALPAGVQARLLQVIDEKVVRPTGSDVSHLVDVRIVAATDRDVEAAVRDGRLREDLFYRLSPLRVRVPPLRERRADIPLLAAHFIRRLDARFGRVVHGLTDDARVLLSTYPFPGNVRELENLLERAYAQGATGEIGIADLPRRLGGVGVDTASALFPRLPDVERELVLRAVRAHAGDRKAAARALGISVRTLFRRLKDYGL